ncbi:GPI mannosyltransferase 2 [Ilyonectria robusta]|uniref:GPI mannosyltransferase 2 n=1 Tax=Ilyonectria robusta TaxID=1079257 RepID=UPI001E8DA004|nr:GPI mannosyltransferase 2 [Ilyonectria robusta]KAH8722250.1 GPI mannosyltransferase 2 [Ilyonectria robusta]
MSLLDHESRPFLSLTAAFAAWKAFLLAIALGAAGASDYDTSTSVFFDVLYGSEAPVPTVAARLTRWDALYFMSSAHRGYVYEQEWAFAMGLPIVVRAIGRVFAALGVDLTGVWEPVAAVAVAHVSHLIAVLALYKLTIAICNDRRLAFVASVIHILSPAGLFLSAPYAESPFSCLSFVGNLLFALSFKSSPDSLRRNAAVIGAGIVFGLSNTFRSNGLFSGLLFAVEVVQCLLAFIDAPSFSKVLRFVAPILGGLLVATGAIVPQVIAWMRYCGGNSPEAELRPWCSRLIPSIYTFVQEEYWNVGFLKYWTPNQIPMFLLAGPMLTILLKSGTDTLREPSRGLRRMGSGTTEQYRIFVRTLAATQTILAVLAITNYHVQIISRLSSGYPVWYWWVASCMMDKKRQGWGYAVTVFIVMYASIQGGLFASFLPPA